MADDVEENAHQVESDQSTEQSRQRRQEQIYEMTAVGADERPDPRDQAEDVARTQAARVGERDLAGSRGRGDSWFSAQSNCRDSLAGGGASGGQYAVFEHEFRRASDGVLIAAERIAALEIR